MNQNAAILRRLDMGDTLTPIDALNDPDIRSFRLAARIKDLRDDKHDIETVAVELPNGKVVAGYRKRVFVDPNGQRRLVA